MTTNEQDQLIEKAVSACHGNTFLYKYISANDAGRTGAHQSGFYIPNSCWPLIFENPGINGVNKDRIVTITWNDDFETESRFIWYGKGTRSEYRLTRFGRDFPFLSDAYIGSLLVISCDRNDNSYRGFVIDSDEGIERFQTEFNISPIVSCGLIRRDQGYLSPLESDSISSMFESFIKSVPADVFPATQVISLAAREICGRLGQPSDPDGRIVRWLDTEYSLFKYIEGIRYADTLDNGFGSLDELIEFANSILNRRKSRAGRSLEHHLGAMFDYCKLPYISNPIIEGRKKPDFIFPGDVQYNDASYPKDQLVFLAAKTTCKDRWRQILTEADRIDKKYLFTLQQGISANQLHEMMDVNVHLVIPKSNISAFPDAYHDKLLTLKDFISITRKTIRVS
ncbi:type II restriction endonuclease [Methanocalculus sp.]|uniref:type II restriction endonuclease n=1 Tax=Methanocalculus sp. TaxID=2004547 RepID=UPI0026208986|nr:type II restriction endonuclease [Methanocalculus sp.]